MNDNYVLALVLTILLSVNIAGYHANIVANNSATLHDTSHILDEVEQGGISDAVSLFFIITGVLVWSFGQLPVYLDIFLLIFRVLGWYLFIKIIRGVAS